MRSCPPVGVDVVLEFRIEDEPLCRLAYLAIYVSHTVSIVELHVHCLIDLLHIGLVERKPDIYVREQKRRRPPSGKYMYVGTTFQDTSCSM